MPAVDHLVYAAPTLEQGIAEIEALLGVRPVPGGRHPQYGTHNALLSLGPRTYLEVIAPDPALPEPEGGRLFGVDDLNSPRLVTWVLATDEIHGLAERAASAGLDIGAIEPGRRERPDGSAITWVASDPYAMHFGGLVPFVIDWGDSTHPGSVAPPAGRLVRLEGQHPEPEAVRGALASMGVSLHITSAPRPILKAIIETTTGLVELQ